jgi:hypothetical protein
MSCKKYYICKTWKGYYEEEIHFEGTIELDDKVISAVNDDWRKLFYPSITTPQKIAEHIAFNMIVNDLKLSGIDGFANLWDEMAILY